MTPPPLSNPVDPPLLPLLLLGDHTSRIPTINSSSTKGRLQRQGLGSTPLLLFLLLTSSSNSTRSTSSTSTHKINGVLTASSLLPNSSKEGIEVPGEDKGRDRMREGREGKEEGMEPFMVARDSMVMGLIMACTLDKQQEEEQGEGRRGRRWVPRLRVCGGA